MAGSELPIMGVASAILRMWWVEMLFTSLARWSDEGAPGIIWRENVLPLGGHGW